MAKTVKFNLVCDGFPIRTLEDLQEHFVIEDVLNYYYHEGKLLERWLDVRGYQEQLDAVREITETAPQEVIKRLLPIFGLDAHDDKIEQDLAMLNLLEQKKKRQLVSILNQIEQNQNAEKSEEADDSNAETFASCASKTAIEQYFNDYQSRIDTILANPNEASTVKKMLEELVTDYRPLFEKDYRRLFYLFLEEALLANYCMLMNPMIRNYVFPNDLVECTDAEKKDKESMIKTLNAVEMSKVKKTLGENLLKGDSTKLKCDEINVIEREGKKIMVIYVGQDDNMHTSSLVSYAMGKEPECIIQSYDVNMTKYSYPIKRDKTNYRPNIILNGLRFSPSSKNDKIYYMEV